MLESDADRLASIKELGGQLVRVESGVEFWAVFDEPGSITNYDDTHMNSTSPTLTARTSDVQLFNLGKRAAVTVIEGDFTVREHRRGEAQGWSVLYLDEA